MSLIKRKFITIIKYFFKIVAILLFIFFSLFVIFHFFPVGNELAKGINQKSIASLKMGMTQKEVLSILGKPINIKKDNRQTFYYEIFIYGRSGFLSGTDMNTVFRNNQLERIYIGFWGASFYYCDKDICRAGEPFYYNWFIPKE